MTSVMFVVLSGTLTFGVPMALALYELRHLQNTGGGGGPPPPSPPKPIVPKPLPDCLLPKPVGSRDASQVRALESA